MLGSEQERQDRWWPALLWPAERWASQSTGGAGPCDWASLQLRGKGEGPGQGHHQGLQEAPRALLGPAEHPRLLESLFLPLSLMPLSS